MHRGNVLPGPQPRSWAPVAVQPLSMIASDAPFMVFGLQERQAAGPPPAAVARVPIQGLTRSWN
eukprot:10420814-Lingulodinium_polyedra.AAC.1